MYTSAENKWFDLLFSQEHIVEQKVKTTRVMHNEKIYHDGKKVAELFISGSDSLYTFS
ncbi:MAG: hypothetical protein KUG64_10740 [Cycloclasticus sp.]|nr:hypothetical protein [Cycloclasticus sp.]